MRKEIQGLIDKWDVRGVRMVNFVRELQSILDNQPEPVQKVTVDDVRNITLREFLQTKITSIGGGEIMEAEDATPQT